MNTTGKKVLLASNSPRRKELLSMIQQDYEIARMHDVDESYPESLPAAEVPGFLSRLKADHYKHQLSEGEVMVTADTVVILEGKILGKPHSPQEAIDMLRELSGKTHIVVTGVTLTTTTGSDTFSETTEVTFKDLSEKEIKDYVDTLPPHGQSRSIRHTGMDRLHRHKRHKGMLL